jgi:hypothetical protein
MKNNAVPQGWRNCSVVLLGAALGAALLMALSGPIGTASAAKIVGKDGKIYACYRVGGGKAKGTVRLIRKRMHCRRGERKVSWSVRGPSGAAGQNGQTGSAGQNGQSGSTGTSNNATLESKVTELSDRLKTLEGVLSGVTNVQLQEAIGTVSDVNALCGQATALTSQVNAVGSALEGIGLGGIIPVGLELLVPTLPAALPSFSCP